MTDSVTRLALAERIAALLTSFKLPTASAQMTERLVRAGVDDALPVVLEVLELEAADRLGRRVERLRRASHLPPSKTFETFVAGRLPKPLLAKLRTLASGQFVEEAKNVLCFGLPGVGKTHAACALGEALVREGYSVCFTPTYQLVQELLAAKRDLCLPRALRRYDVFDVLILDDLGYVQQSPEEAEVLFTLLAERYERRSIVLTSNLVFSQWDRIFRNPMTTAAAIDRLVHHAVVLEFVEVASYRSTQATLQNRGRDNNDNDNDARQESKTTSDTNDTKTTTASDNNDRKVTTTTAPPHAERPLSTMTLPNQDRQE
jgi:DNA replication protein DnaC